MKNLEQPESPEAKNPLSPEEVERHQKEAMAIFEKGLAENITPEEYEAHMEAIRKQRDVGKGAKRPPAGPGLRDLQ